MTTTHSRPPGYWSIDDCRIEDLERIVGQTTELTDYPHAEGIRQGVVVYSSAELRKAMQDPLEYRQVLAELAGVFADGPGIAVFTGAFDPGVVASASAAFDDLIAEQKRSGATAGDHFATPGANDRVWNALEKLALAHPEVFVDYYDNDILALASSAWLGPGYQVTSQINVVNPGGAGQTVHRDYHLGFLSADACSHYPEHVHRLSMTLTLQGAVAHCDMPVESGPTLYLPHSQKYGPGYLAYWREDFQEYFAANHVQLPLRTGDAVFFNPALFHAAGSNHTADIRRMANLLQVSSAFGRAMETVDRAAVVQAIYPSLLTRACAGADRARLERVIAASAEGYPFPTNLDNDQPVDGMTPASQADVVRGALAGRRPVSEVTTSLARQMQDKRS